MAIVLVEQYYDFAAELADRYLVMERGEVVQRGRGADMARRGRARPDVDLTCAAPRRSQAVERIALRRVRIRSWLRFTPSYWRSTIAATSLGRGFLITAR